MCRRADRGQPPCEALGRDPRQLLDRFDPDALQPPCAARADPAEGRESRPLDPLVGGACIRSQRGGQFLGVRPRKLPDIVDPGLLERGCGSSEIRNGGNHAGDRLRVHGRDRQRREGDRGETCRHDRDSRRAESPGRPRAARRLRRDVEPFRGVDREARDDQGLPDRERLQREERKSEESRHGHLEDLPVIEAGNRVDPAPACEAIVRLPQEPDREAGGEEAKDAARVAAFEVSQERPARRAAEDPRIDDEEDPAPYEGEERSRPDQRQPEHRRADHRQDPASWESQGAIAAGSRDTERAEEPLGQQDGGDDGRER